MRFKVVASAAILEDYTMGAGIGTIAMRVLSSNPPPYHVLKVFSLIGIAHQVYSVGDLVPHVPLAYDTKHPRRLMTNRKSIMLSRLSQQDLDVLFFGYIT